MIGSPGRTPYNRLDISLVSGEHDYCLGGTQTLIESNEDGTFRLITGTVDMGTGGLSSAGAQTDQVSRSPTVAAILGVPSSRLSEAVTSDDGSVVAFRDVSARRQLEADLRWAAEHDSLTKLYNRAWFENQLEQEIARLRRSNNSSLLLFLDVDRFKYINDTAGHNAGDQLLVEVSQRLRTRLLSYFRCSFPEDKGARIVREAEEKVRDLLRDAEEQAVVAVLALAQARAGQQASQETRGRGHPARMRQLRRRRERIRTLVSVRTPSQAAAPVRDMMPGSENRVATPWRSIPS